jgi:phosphate transport system protein
MEHKHIVKSYDNELEALKKHLLEMGGLAESQLKESLQVLVRHDPKRAQKLVERDKKMDALEAEVASSAIKLIALRQPMAEDLRVIITALKASANLERMGDYSKNIAARVITLAKNPVLVGVSKSIARMGDLVIAMIHDVLDAFVARDAAKALSVLEADRDVDRHYTGLFREILTYMMEDARNISLGTHLMFIAKNVERIGDHATNIAEQVHFMVEGAYPADERPKEDESATILVDKDD